jgi:hypothetical protein
VSAGNDEGRPRETGPDQHRLRAETISRPNDKESPRRRPPGLARPPRQSSAPPDSLPADVAVFAAFSQYRLAARSILRAETLSDKTQRVGLVKLVEMARNEFGDGDWIAVQAQKVIYAESRDFLLFGRMPTAPSQSWWGDPVTTACWTLRRQGYDRCETCRRPLPDEAQLTRQEDMDRAAWHQALAIETAPTGEGQGGHV